MLFHGYSINVKYNYYSGILLYMEYEHVDDISIDEIDKQYSLILKKLVKFI